MSPQKFIAKIIAKKWFKNNYDHGGFLASFLTDKYLIFPIHLFTFYLVCLFQIRIAAIPCFSIEKVHRSHAIIYSSYRKHYIDIPIRPDGAFFSLQHEKSSNKQYSPLLTISCFLVSCELLLDR